MMAPAWVLDVFAVLMLVVAAVSAARLAAVRPWRRAPVAAIADVAHLLMAIAMAGMLAASLTALPDTAWEVTFGLLTAWFAWQVWRDARADGIRAVGGGHGAPHLVHSAAMLYMLLALAVPAGGPGMAGMGAMAPRYPTLAFAFALILGGYGVWDLDRVSGSRYGLTGPGVRAFLLSSGTTAVCRVVMGVTMAFMLVIMI